MRVIIAGSRSITDPRILQQAINICGWTPTVVLSGGARGADFLGEIWAMEHGVPLERFPAEWATLGLRAGIVRNCVMAEQADALIALWDGMSHGTAHMIQQAYKRRLRVHIERTDTNRAPKLYNRLNGPAAPLDAVYIGRPSKWGNPFVIGRDGDRATVIEKYRRWIVLQPKLYLAAKRELAGRDLVCFCAPEACHGDVLLEIANENR